MNRRQFLRTSALAGAGAIAAPMLNLGRFRLFAANAAGYSARTLEVVGRTTVVDMLGLLTLDWRKLQHWFREPASFDDAERRALAESGISVFHPAVEPNDPDPHAATRRWLGNWNRFLDARLDAFLRIDGPGDFTRLRADGRLGLLLGFQNSEHFRTPADVAEFHRLGQRVSQLTYNGGNRLGSGCFDARDRGLTGLGAETVAAMNLAGMAVDVSHCSERTSLDAIAASATPVLVTHANCRALTRHPRCKSDKVIRALGARNGVMGITALPAFVRQGGTATIEHLLDHFDHVARLVGIEHAGLGTDMDSHPVDPRTRRLRPAYALEGLRHPKRVFDIAEGLLARGYAESDVEGVLGGNFERALSAIWTAAPPASA